MGRRWHSAHRWENDRVRPFFNPSAHQLHYAERLILGKEPWRNTWDNAGLYGWELPYHRVGHDTWSPRTDILEIGGNLRIEFELPGVPVECVELSFENDNVIVQTIKPQTKKEMKAYYYQNERHFGNFYRKIALPSNADVQLAGAMFEYGVLKVTIPLHDFSTQPNLKRLNIMEVTHEQHPSYKTDTPKKK